MSHTPVYGTLRQLLRKSQQVRGSATNHVGAGVGDLWSRRRFLKTLGAVAPAALLAGCGVRYSAVRSGERPSVAVIGGGIAGMSAAWHLNQSGLSADVYEAGSRLGGRIFTVNDVIVRGGYTELGGEFVNSTHVDMLSLAREFDISLIDNFKEVASLKDSTFLVDNEAYAEEAIVETFMPYGEMIAADNRKLEEDYDRYAPEFDRMTVQEYLQDRLGMSGWVYRFFEGAYTAEFGRNIDQQTALYVIWMMPYVEGRTMHMLGSSDEHYRLRGGNTQLLESIARSIGPDAIHLEHGVEAIRQSGNRMELAFGGNRSRTVDYVILTVPFSVVRERIDIQVPLSDEMTRCVEELPYGENSKLLAGFKGRPWREAGCGGNLYGSGVVSMGWDNTLGQDTSEGGWTAFYGGTQHPAGQSAAKGIVPVLKVLDGIYPGLGNAYNGRTVDYRWAQQPLSRGSYACWAPGQYTGFLDAMLYEEDEDGGFSEVRAGNLIFAGEHCSGEYQGFMNGGAQTGRLAAQTILRDLRE